MSRSRSKLAGVAEDISDEENYDDDKYDEEEVGGGTDADVQRGVDALMRGRGRVDAGTKEGAEALVKASEGLWGSLYGGTKLTKPTSRYYRCVIVRIGHDKTYTLKYADGEKRSGVSKSYFKVPKDVHRDDVDDWIQRNKKRLMARKPQGFKKSRMNEMALPAVLRKEKNRNKMRFASEEDARECTFGKKKKKRRGKGAGQEETKENADFLIRMEAKETARRAEIERKKKEAKNLLRKSRANTKKWTDEDGEKFLHRLAEAEKKKKEKYKRLQKQLRPAFNITEKQVYNAATRKIETVKIERAQPDLDGFLRRLAEDDALRKAKLEKRLAATAMATPGRKAPHSEPSFNNTYEY